MTALSNPSSRTTTTIFATAASIATVGVVYAMHKVWSWLQQQQQQATTTTGALPVFLTQPKTKGHQYDDIIQILAHHLNELSGDELVKICRQLDFWIAENTLSDADLVALTKRLVQAGTLWRRTSHRSIGSSSSSSNSSCSSRRQDPSSFQVPKVRFGRTELSMPIITCGAMRFQHTWMPDHVMSLVMQPGRALHTPSQDNLCAIVRTCLAVGINHFETARFYGTSEMQLTAALHALMEGGEITRSDFVYQTKVPVVPDKQVFVQRLQESWLHCQKLGYIDLFGFHCVSKTSQVELLLDDDSKDGIMAVIKEWQAMGRIKHIGFSTHGTAANIMRLICSNKFDYVNLHYHYFGSYHAQGTDDTVGGHGNAACVAKAHELDMGVFGISGIDKGGRQYQPSATVARTIGPELTPIAFCALKGWETLHTISIGFGRPEDLTEILYAAQLFANPAQAKPLVQGATDRLDKLARQKLGDEWHEKGLLGLPSPFDKPTDGVGLGHILWCYNMLYAYGMYDVAKARYDNLISESKKWDKKKTFEENIKAINAGNPMRSFENDIDLKQVLVKHYDPSLAEQRIREMHQLFGGKPLSKAERTTQKWDQAYDLRPWHEFPDSDRASTTGVLLQNLSRGWLGIGGGPTARSKNFALLLKETIANQANTTSA